MAIISVASGIERETLKFVWSIRFMKVENGLSSTISTNFGPWSPPYVPKKSQAFRFWLTRAINSSNALKTRHDIDKYTTTTNTFVKILTFKNLHILYFSDKERS